MCQTLKPPHPFLLGPPVNLNAIKRRSSGPNRCPATRPYSEFLNNKAYFQFPGQTCSNEMVSSNVNEKGLSLLISIRERVH